LTYGSKAWTDDRKIMAAEMKFIRRMSACTFLDYIRDLDIIKVLRTQPITELIENYRSNWKSHVLQMPTQESSSYFPVTNQMDKHLWEDPSNTGMRS
jgi:hypothetical protein